MNIILPAEQQKWLEAEIAAGRFISIDEALPAAVAGLMATDEDDLAWAKPFVDEARAAITRGEHISLDEFRAEIRETIAALIAERPRIGALRPGLGPHP